MQKIEMFFHCGDIDKQVNFLYYPESLNYSDQEELLKTINIGLSEYLNEGISLNKSIIQKLNKEKIYPNPTKYKKYSKWYYGQLSHGTVLYRFSIDGSLESKSGRFDPTFEGAYLPNVSLSNSIKKYGVDFLKEVENIIPNNFEQMLIAKNTDLYSQTFQMCAKSENMDNLYRRFFVACGEKEKNTMNEEVDVNLAHLGIFYSLRFGK